MNRLSVKVTGKGAHWQVQMSVNGNVDTADVFACREGILPMLRSFDTAEREYNAVLAGTGAASGYSVPSIAVTMPSGRVLTYTLREVKESLTDEIQGSAGVRGRGGAGQPVD